MRATNAVIVGAVPCGLAAASFLSYRGVPVTVLERAANPAAFDVARTYKKGIFGNGLCALPDLQATIVPRCIPRDTTLLATLRPEVSVARVPADLALLSQPVSLLRSLRSGHLAAFLKLAETSPGVTVRAATSVEQLAFGDDGAVSLTLECDGARETIESRFMLACDGLNSVVAATLQRDTNSSGPALRSRADFAERRWATRTSRLQRKTLVLRP